MRDAIRWFKCKLKPPKRNCQREFLWTGSTVQKQKKNANELRPILSAAHRLEEYCGKCKMEGTDLIIRGKCYSFENLSELP